RRLALLPGLDDQPLLRLADREADRLGADARRRDRPNAAGARRVRDLGSRSQDDHPVPPADPRPSPVPLRRRHDRLRRALHVRGSGRGRRLEEETMADASPHDEVAALKRIIEITGLLNTTLDLDE